MSTSPKAKQAAEHGYSTEARAAAVKEGICGQALLPFLIGYDAATAKHTVEQYKTAIEQIVSERTASSSGGHLIRELISLRKSEAKLREELADMRIIELRLQGALDAANALLDANKQLTHQQPSAPTPEVDCEGINAVPEKYRK